MTVLLSRLLLAFLLVDAGTAAPALPAPREVIDGPVEAHVMKVIDGDTFLAEARIWPHQRITVKVRIRGIDAPETRTRCKREKNAGELAKRALIHLIDGRTVWISAISGGKYYGRVLADVTTREGIDPSEHLLALNLVRVYAGGRRKKSC